MKRFAAILLALTLLLAGCTVPVSPTPTPALTPAATSPIPLPTSGGDVAESNIFAMDTVMSFRVHGENGQDMLALIANAINALERELSVTREGSDVWRINHAGGESVTVGEAAAYLLSLAKELGDSTGGALDMTMYPVVKAWGFTTSEYRVPSGSELSGLLEHVDYQKVEIEQKPADLGDTYVTLPADMELDLGSIAKGYAGECAANLLRENGVTSALLNMGGNVQSVGSKPDGSPWRIGIQDPNETTGSYLGILQLVDQAAITSGGYERFFEEDGVRYWHIMDPHTGAPARSGLVSVTIVGNKGGLCDGLSTALFVLGREKALDYWRTYGGFEAILVDEDNNVWVTGGLKDSFALVEGSSYTLRLVEE